MADSQAGNVPRVSRYRSQRRAQQHAQDEDVPEVPDHPLQEEGLAGEGVARSQSRYHRKPSVATEPTTRAEPSPPREHANPLRSQPSQRRYRERRVTPPAQLGAEDLEQTQSYERNGQDGEVASVRPTNGRSTRDVASAPPQTHTASQPTGELFPPPRQEPVRTGLLRGDGPPASGRIQATKSVTELLTFVESDDEDGGCFGLFKRKKDVAPQAEKRRMPHDRDGPRAILAGGGGIVPGIDAPVSAVNAGDRKVLVECGRQKTIFTVTPTTTTVDLIKSAANTFQQYIDVRSAVLLEHFDTVGVRRPLRRYEHIRDVMNSWDTDRQNTLTLIDPGTGSSEVELSVAGVPRQKPGDVSWLLPYSQKVGKWDKRVVTLKPDGQITQHKDPNKPQQAENVCHLSDFDIYMPTKEKLRKKIKPPKSMCFAIKSQQKTIMFESTQNYVHFFSTNDRRTGDDFYGAVQGWRSWYLVNVMGEGKKTKPVVEPLAAERGSGNGAVQQASGYRNGESYDSNHHLGSVKPLLNMDQFDNRPVSSRSANAPPTSAGGFAKSANQFDTTASPERRASTAKRNQQPGTMLNNRAHHPENEPVASLGRHASVREKRTSMDQARPTRDAFDANGLLGRQYSQRRQELDERERIAEQPFVTNGPTLLNGSRLNDGSHLQSTEVPRRNQSTRDKHPHKATSSSELRRIQSTRNRGSVDLARSGSTRVREMPRPLIDLTPQYQAPPQHSKVGKGRGYHPDQIGPGGLIDNATSPDEPIAIPPAADWRAGRNGVQNSSSPRPTTARAPHSGPLMDMSEPNVFVPGSLLNRVAREQGSDGPVIDRTR